MLKGIRYQLILAVGLHNVSRQRNDAELVSRRRVAVNVDVDDLDAAAYLFKLGLVAATWAACFGSES